MSVANAGVANAGIARAGLTKVSVANAGLANAGLLDDLRGLAATKPDESLGDLRFRALLSDDDWASLPLPIRRRFTKRLAGGRTVVYAGEIVETRMSAAGWCVAQLARFVGAPLPLSRDANVPSVVTVTEDMATGGQIWTRLYTRRRGFPQIIHSSKRFAVRPASRNIWGAVSVWSSRSACAVVR